MGTGLRGLWLGPGKHLGASLSFEPLPWFVGQRPRCPMNSSGREFLARAPRGRLNAARRRRPLSLRTLGAGAGLRDLCQCPRAVSPAAWGCTSGTSLQRRGYSPGSEQGRSCQCSPTGQCNQHALKPVLNEAWGAILCPGACLPPDGARSLMLPS